MTEPPVRRTSHGGVPRRYTIEYTHPKTDERTRVRVVTPSGETMAATLAAARFYRENPDARISRAEVVVIEEDFEPDPTDGLDYWGLN